MSCFLSLYVYLYFYLISPYDGDVFYHTVYDRYFMWGVNLPSQSLKSHDGKYIFYIYIIWWLVSGQISPATAAVGWIYPITAGCPAAWCPGCPTTWQFGVNGETRRHEFCSNFSWFPTNLREVSGAGIHNLSHITEDKILRSTLKSRRVVEIPNPVIDHIWHECRHCSHPSASFAW